jgi:hypothetical protein
MTAPGRAADLAKGPDAGYDDASSGNASPQ